MADLQLITVYRAEEAREDRLVTTISQMTTTVPAVRIIQAIITATTPTAVRMGITETLARTITITVITATTLTAVPTGTMATLARTIATTGTTVTITTAARTGIMETSAIQTGATVMLTEAAM
jgi:hypothetical protein